MTEDTFDLEKVEVLSSDDLTKAVLDPGVAWIQGPFYDEWKARYKSIYAKSKQKNQELGKADEDILRVVELQASLARYLHIVSQNRKVAFQLEPKILNAIFGTNEDSLVSCLGPDNRERMKEQLNGVLSVLTLWDVLKETNPKITAKLSKLKVILPQSNLDADYKIDVVMDFNGKNKMGEKVVRLSQLKTDKSPWVDIVTIHPEEKKGYFNDRISAKDVYWMNKGGNMYYRDARKMYFGVMLPNYNTSVIQNVYGIIHPNYPKREEFISDFRTKAIETGFIPGYLINQNE